MPKKTNPFRDDAVLSGALRGVGFDPYCGVGTKMRRVNKRKTTSPGMRKLVSYVESHLGKVWEVDNKIFVSHPMWNDIPLTAVLEGEAPEFQAAKLFTAFRKAIGDVKRTNKVNKSMDELVRNNRFPEPSSELSMADNSLYGNVMPFLNDTPAFNDLARFTTGFRWLGSFGAGNKWFIPMQSALARSGPLGNRAANMMKATNELNGRLEGVLLTKVQKALDDPLGDGVALTKEEVGSKLQLFIEQGRQAADIAPERVPYFEAAHKILKQTADEVYATLQRLGVPVKAKIGPSELVPTGEYFPHLHDIVLARSQELSINLVDDFINVMSTVQPGVRPMTRTDAIAELQKLGVGGTRKRVTDGIKASSAKYGRVVSDTEADRIYDQYIRKNSERIAGNVERARSGATGYITDARRAYTMAFRKGARRISEVAVFGLGDKHMLKVLDELNDTNPILGQFARKAYYMQIGKEGAHLEGWSQSLFNWQMAKMSFSALPNMGQPQNTAIRTGIAPMVKAGLDYHKALFKGTVKNPKDPLALIRKRVEEAGAMPKRMFESDDTISYAQQMVEGFETRAQREILQGKVTADEGTRAATNARKLAAKIKGPLSVRTLENALLWPFSMVELWNRYTAVVAGELYFDRTVKVMKDGGQKSKFVRADVDKRLTEIGFNPEAVRAARNNPHALDEMRVIAGQRISNETQFKGGQLSLPQFANESEIGKLFYQFKTFPLNQVGFMMNEIVGAHGDPARRLRAASAIMVTYPAFGLLIAGMRGMTIGKSDAIEEIEQWMNEGSAVSMLGVFVAAHSISGSFGILMDVANNVALGNQFNMANLIMPPSASTFFNGLTAASAFGKAIFTPDERLETAAKGFKALGRELGGVGTAGTRRLVNRLDLGDADDEFDTFGYFDTITQQSPALNSVINRLEGTPIGDAVRALE
jgi:hypothetical protein